MPAKYLLPCPCGLNVSVSTSQAGADVHCQCGQTLSVPTMLEVKRLPPDRQDSFEKPQRRWTPLQGGVFVAGTSIAIISLGVGILLAVARSKLDTRKPRLIPHKKYVEHTEKLTVDQLWETWELLSHPEVLPRRPPVPDYLRSRRLSRNLQIAIFVAGGFLFAGAALSTASFFLRGSPRRRRRRRPPPKPSRGGSGS